MVGILASNVILINWKNAVYCSESDLLFILLESTARTTGRQRSRTETGIHVQHFELPYQAVVLVASVDLIQFSRPSPSDNIDRTL